MHLLPANKKHSALPGDDKQMVAARRDFLEAGWYQPFSDRLNQLVADFLRPEDRPLLLDAGCGEGYYTGGSPRRSDPRVRIAAFDISKSAVQAAAKRYPAGLVCGGKCVFDPGGGRRGGLPRQCLCADGPAGVFAGAAPRRQDDLCGAGGAASVWTQAGALRKAL